MSRPFTCRRCGQPAEADTTTGPLPSTCATCDPDTWATRQEKRAASLASARRRAARTRELEQRVTDLEDLLGTAATVTGSRLELARAVRAVGHAQGRDQTRDALLHLRNVAQAWADVLRRGDTKDTSEDLAA